MSKKSRRARAKFQAPPGSPKQFVQKQIEKPQLNNIRKVMPASTGTGATALRSHNFEHLRADLRNLTIIAGALFIILIVLAFIIK